MTATNQPLHGRRIEAVRAWTAFVEHGDRVASRVRPEILNSWERSGAAVSADVTEAPMADEDDTASFWRGSPLQVAVSRIEDELRRTAEDGDLVLAVTDAQTRILWTYGGRVMRRKAETVNFVAGGRWDETSTWRLGRTGRRWCSAPSTTHRSCTTGCAGPPRSTTR
jgi:transcriptional regulator of acetoin/glycerol metabolism